MTDDRSSQADADAVLEAARELTETVAAVHHSVAVRAGITDAEMRLMFELLRAPAGLSERVIAAQTGLPIGSVRDLCEGLVERGFVSITPSSLEPRGGLVRPAVSGDDEPWNDLVDVERRVDTSVAALERRRVHDATQVLQGIAHDVQSEEMPVAEGVSHGDS